MKLYQIKLYRAPECIRGWLAYIKSDSDFTLLVNVHSETGAKAKNKAITLANNSFDELDIVSFNCNGIWGVDKHPDIKRKLDARQ